MTSTVITDLDELAESIAQQLIVDKASKPVCFGSRTPWRSSPLCEKIYYQWRSLQGNLSVIPRLTYVSHSINLSGITGMEIELQTITGELRKSGYSPDVYITLSEHIFSALNYVSPILFTYIKFDKLVGSVCCEVF